MQKDTRGKDTKTNSSGSTNSYSQNFGKGKMSKRTNDIQIRSELQAGLVYLQDEESVVGEVHSLSHQEVGDLRVRAGGVVHEVLGGVVAECDTGYGELGVRDHLVLLVVLHAGERADIKDGSGR